MHQPLDARLGGGARDGVRPVPMHAGEGAPAALVENADEIDRGLRVFKRRGD